MSKALVRAAALAVFVGGLQVAPAGHALVNKMFVFGDSLSDPGNAAAMTVVGPGQSFFPPSQPSPVPGLGIPYDYRFSNGPVAFEYLAGYLGIAPSLPAWPASPANSNPNFAVGGAMSGVGPTQTPPISPPFPPVPIALPPGTQGLCCNFNWLVDSPAGLQVGFPAVNLTGLNNQVDLFKSRLIAGAIPPFDPETTLFAVWGGPNDIFLALALVDALGLTGADAALVLSSYAANAALNIGMRIGELALLGGKHFLVPNMPNMGATPFADDAGLIPELTGLSMLFNTVLDGTLDTLRASFGLDIIEFDTFAALDNLIAGGTFPITGDPCLDTSSPATIAASIPTILAGCPGYLFFDGVHPTTATAQILAQQFYSAIPEPGSIALLAAPLLLLGGLRRARRI
ncbi:MAG TPA: SGNH/GDSL hydrolase family protein [Burkholderiales bacterium]|nr:SGNH/GDSL hydrolase family protein [Burkholderiales bacterium]